MNKRSSSEGREIKNQKVNCKQGQRVRGEGFDFPRDRSVFTFATEGTEYNMIRRDGELNNASIFLSTPSMPTASESIERKRVLCANSKTS